MQRKPLIVNTFLLIAATLILLAGCVSPMGMTASTTPLEGKKTEIIGKGEGCSNWAGAVFGLWTVNRADINRGIENALLMETGVSMVRKTDNKELVMEKGAVIVTENAATVTMEAAEPAAAVRKPAGKPAVYTLVPGAKVFMKEGKLLLADNGKETEITGGDVIRSGAGLELRYIAPQEGARALIRKNAGDMLVLIDGSPRRLKDDEALAVGDGFSLSRLTGDALVNVRWYERTYFFVFFSLHRVYVQGDVIRFVKDELPESLPEKAEPRKTGGQRGR